jgi:hypothetical protein
MILKSTRVVPCEWLGSDQDPRDGPTTPCGHPSLPGKSYCAEHYPRVYVVGSALTKGRSAGQLRKNNRMTPEELDDLFNEVVKELEEEGVL